MFLLYFFVVKFNILYPSYYLFLFFIIVGFTYFVLQFRVNSINPISSRLSLSFTYAETTRSDSDYYVGNTVRELCLTRSADFILDTAELNLLIHHLCTS